MYIPLLFLLFLGVRHANEGGLRMPKITVATTTTKSVTSKATNLTGLLWPYPLNNTFVPCCNTSMCQQSVGQGLWCRSGVVCLARQCHTVPNQPCGVDDTCIEANRTCRKRVCTTAAQCNDGIYCNGAEQCIRGQCYAAVIGHCYGGFCNEATHQCSYPTLLAGWLAYFGLSSKQHKSRTTKEGGAAAATLVATRNSDMAHAQWGNGSFAPFHDDDDGHHHHDNTNWTAWLLIGLGVIIFFILVFLMIALVNRNWVPVPVSGATWGY